MDEYENEKRLLATARTTSDCCCERGAVLCVLKRTEIITEGKTVEASDRCLSGDLLPFLYSETTILLKR